MKRVHRGAGEAAHANARGATGHRTCLECGAPTATRASFCSIGCRRRWNNRRKVRGAVLYDLYMAHRYDRPIAEALQALSLINRLVSTFRAEDNAARAGRRSWRKPGAVLDERPYLRAEVLQRPARPRRK